MDNFDMKLIPIVLVMCVLTVMFGLSQASASKIDALINKQSAINENLEISERKINNLSSETRKLIEEYKDTQIKTDNLIAYNNYLSNVINAQKEEEISLTKQLNSIDETAQGIVPLMLKMIDSLEVFVKLDVPFLLYERKGRIEKINKMMMQADVTISEKYRRILEAYKIEMDYGRTIETYKDTLDLNNEKHTVNYFRLGRVVFIYQSLDGSKSGVWDKETKTWENIGTDYKQEISKSIRMAMKQLPPDFLILPVKSPELSK